MLRRPARQVNCDKQGVCGLKIKKEADTYPVSASILQIHPTVRRMEDL